MPCSTLLVANYYFSAVALWLKVLINDWKDKELRRVKDMCLLAREPELLIYYYSYYSYKILFIVIIIFFIIVILLLH